MITPYFEIRQDDEFIYIDIKVSHTRFSSKSIEMVVDSEVFIFSLTPYYLRLRFPHACIDDERATASFDSREDMVKIKVPKEEPGRFFPDLDLSAKLLARSSEKPKLNKEQKTNLVSEDDISSTIERVKNVQETVEDAEAFDWEIKQEMPSIGTDDHPSLRYGFNDEYDGIIELSMANGNDINELSAPGIARPNDKIIERLIKENIKFDPEYYAADYLMEKYSEDDEKDIKHLLDWKSPYAKIFMKWYKAQQSIPAEQRQAVLPVDFSKEEQERMLNLPRKTYLLDTVAIQKSLILLTSVLFAFCYESRETTGDHNVESAWTIGKLTSQISFLDTNLVILSEIENHNLLRASIITGIRRALSYPYVRNFKLCMKCWEDVYFILRGGRRLILKALLEIREFFRYHDIYYVYNKIFFEDLCSWIMSDQVSEGMIRFLAHDLKKEYTTIESSEITFEKPEGFQNDPETADNVENIVAFSLNELELMAEESYRASHIEA